MIEMQYNFPLLPGQGEQWRQHLRDAVDGLQSADPNQLRPTYRIDQKTLLHTASQWIGSTPETTSIVASTHHGTLISLMAAGLAGKIIAVEGITYGGILHQARMLASPLVPVDFDEQGMTPQSLRALCQAKPVAAIFLMPTVHNPLGFTTGLARREAIVAVAREFNLLILEDDAYGWMDPAAPVSLRVLAPERTFYVRGLSKSYAPATRTAFLVAPEPYKPAIDSALKNTASGTCLIHNSAAVSLLTDGSLQQIIDQKLAEGARRNAAARELLGRAATPGAKSAWHLWVTLPDSAGSAKIQQQCEQRGALVSGGHNFSLPGIEPRGLRIALGGELEISRMIEGIQIVKQVLKEAS